MKKPGIHTRAIHAGEDSGARDLTPPLHMATTYLFESAAEAAQAFEQEHLPIYTRWGNPTLRVFERKMAALEAPGAPEGAIDALATASGMAAVSTALLAALRSGDHLVATTGLYSGTYNFVTGDLARYGVRTTLAEATDPQAFAAALRPDTRVVYLESPGNPILVLNDVAGILEVLQGREVLTIVDNTFATPFNQRPLELGVAVVVHSATKFLGGHGDAVAGCLVASADFIARAKQTLRQFGGCLSPFNAWLVARGLQTFPLRMARHNDNALAVAEWLANHPAVAWVRYPWHSSHPQAALARRQMPGGGGGVVVFELKGGVAAGARLLDRVALCARTVSLGDTHTLITHPASTTHHSVPRAARVADGISDGLVRLAVGLEDVADIVADLDQAID
ncbi:MAG: aminotransferase class I/II-fold pyridoxal phosphate-dependent enzyme [Anaerolineae bacterium]|nr:aminotransferase class I/II-fold pyridoxal phosphate-dependent enzyme [Anaerolineae bacterium]